MVAGILNEFERVGMLERKENGKTWGKWVGIDKEGRLPAPSVRDRYRKAAPDGLFTESREGQEEVVTRLAVGKHKDSKDSCAVENSPHTSAVLRVWDYYIEKMNKNPRLLTFTPLRKQKGLARFHEALEKTNGDMDKAEQLLKIAVDSLAASDFHMGKNEQKKVYNSWEKNLFVSNEKFERWLEQS